MSRDEPIRNARFPERNATKRNEPIADGRPAPYPPFRTSDRIGPVFRAFFLVSFQNFQKC